MDNINLDEGAVYVKGSHKLNRRFLPLYPSQIMAFSTYINETHTKLPRCTSSRLILKKLGHPITVDGVNAVIEPLQGLFPDRNLNPRTIRMSVITSWINVKKYPLEKAQELAGHKWPSTTEKYIRADSMKQRELINKYFPSELW